jgi:hypothetical protein
MAPDDDAARRLMVRLLLHLPRLADEAGRVLPADAFREAERLSFEEHTVPDWLRPPAQPPVSPRHLVATEFDLDRTRTIHEHFHYLRSYRQGRHIAGMAGGHVAVLLSFSPLDLETVRTTLPPSLRGGEALVLSRVFTPHWAPRNSLSRMLSQAAGLLRETTPRPRIVLTYLNPGIGFDGASYKAANWSLYGREYGTRYAYVEGTYITDRELTVRFGTSSSSALRRVLGSRISFSSMRLQPLEMYAYALDQRFRVELARTAVQDWNRPWS